MRQTMSIRQAEGQVCARLHQIAGANEDTEVKIITWPTREWGYRVAEVSFVEHRPPPNLGLFGASWFQDVRECAPYIHLVERAVIYLVDGETDDATHALQSIEDLWREEGERNAR